MESGDKDECDMADLDQSSENNREMGMRKVGTGFSIY